MLVLERQYSVLDHGYVKYIGHLGTDLTPLEAARMSTGNPTGVDEAKDNATRDFLFRHAHATPFEMAVLQIEIQCPIFVAREWMRHRTQSFNEFSGRFAELPDLCYTPSADRMQKQAQTNKQASGDIMDEALASEIRGSMFIEQKEAHRNYRQYLAQGLAREVARINIPVSQYTRFRAQANLRNWLHFLSLRMAPNAQWEIRQYAFIVSEIIRTIWPLTYEVFDEHTLNATTLPKTEAAMVRQLVAEALEARGETLEEAIARLAPDSLGLSRRAELSDKIRLREGDRG